MNATFATWNAMPDNVLLSKDQSPWNNQFVIFGLLALTIAFFQPVSKISVFAQRWKYLFCGPDMILSGYQKATGNAFEVPGPDTDHIFISSKQHLKEVQKAGKDELSFFAATRQMFQPAYTMLGHNWLDERGAEGIGYVKAVGTLLPQRIIEIMPVMLHNIEETFNNVYNMHEPGDGGGKTMLSYSLIKKITCNLNGFVFFGEELEAQNEDFMRKVFEYNELVVGAAEVLRVTPSLLKPLIGPFFKNRHGLQENIFTSINSIVNRRLQRKAEGVALPSDLITWIIDTAPPELNWDAQRITYEIIAIWFGSVHALSATISYALYDICLHPEYVPPLREELRKELGSYMSTMQGLPLLDSFIKESTRVNPMEAMSGRRQALKDFVFSDGTKVSKGSWTCVPAKAILQDDKFFPDPLNFNGFRFVQPSDMPDELKTVTQPEGPSKLTDISSHYHNWGIGQIVCPGRFYASVAMKLTLAHILQTYDCTLVDQEQRRDSVWRSYILPADGTLVHFKPRI